MAIEAIAAAAAKTVAAEGAKQAAHEAARQLAQKALASIPDSIRDVQQAQSERTQLEARQIQQLENFRVGENVGGDASEKSALKLKEIEAAEEVRNKIESGQEMETSEKTGGNLPRNDGEWTGERGDSMWKPDAEKVPEKSNPEGKSWEEILDQHGIEGIEFKERYPDFEPISKEDVEIDNFTTDRNKNFDQADVKYAEKNEMTPEKVAEFRKEQNLTWHEKEDMKTLQLVPSEIHNNIPHSGGISLAKQNSSELTLDKHLF